MHRLRPWSRRLQTVGNCQQIAQPHNEFFDVRSIISTAISIDTWLGLPGYLCRQT